MNLPEYIHKENNQLKKLLSTLCCVIDAVQTGAGNQTIIKGLFVAGVDEMGLLTIDADSTGTYSVITDDGASGTITIDYNAGGYAAFSAPLVLSIGDTINVKRTVTTSDGWYKLIGTF